jgi:hypothetical protein
MLYQLSYAPAGFTVDWVGPERIELSTSRLSSVRSNQLSYGPMLGARSLESVSRYSKSRVTPISQNQTASNRVADAVQFSKIGA